MRTPAIMPVAEDEDREEPDRKTWSVRGPIVKGEIVAIKGGHVLDLRTLARTRAQTAVSYVQIEDGFYIGARTLGEVRTNKLFIKHSCDPNLGIRGQVTFVALRTSRRVRS